MYGFFRSLGQSFGVAIGGVLFQNRLQRDLIQSNTPSRIAEQYSKDATGLVFILRKETDGVKKAVLQHAFLSGLKSVWILVAVVSSLALVLSALVKAYNIDVQLQTDQGLVRSDELRSDSQKEQQV